MARQSDLAVLDGACVEHVDENALALANANGIARAKSLVVDREKLGSNFESVGTRVQNSGPFRLRTRCIAFRGFVFGLIGEIRFPVAQSKKDFLVVVSRIVSRVNH